MVQTPIISNLYFSVRKSTGLPQVLNNFLRRCRSLSMLSTVFSRGFSLRGSAGLLHFQWLSTGRASLSDAGCTL